MLIKRRALLTGLGSLIVGAPAIVRASSLMPVKAGGVDAACAARPMRNTTPDLSSA